MINIDGTKVKTLRENQNLTQLYIATAVGVTTDTISRWENKRYPTIKEENAIKLAEALEVDLKAILEEKEEDESASANINIETAISDENIEHKSSQEIPQSTEEPAVPLVNGSKGNSKWWIALSILVALSAISFFSYFQLSDNGAVLSATRQTPNHYIPGLPFPIVITVDPGSNSTGSYVVKENLPPDASIVATSPEIQISKIKNNTIKWLKKGELENKFIYTLIVDPEKIVNQLAFSGNITSSKNKTLATISGSNFCEASMYHWADQNKDNRISDQEILTAYDLYSGAPSIDFETLEDIWMGTGYRWDGKKQVIQLLP